MLVRVVVDGSVKSVEPLVGQSDATWACTEACGRAAIDMRRRAGGVIHFSDDLGGRVFRLGYVP